MEQSISAILAGLLSSLFVGLVLAVFKVKLDENVHDHAEANKLKLKTITDRMDSMTSKAESSEKKIDEIQRDVHRIDTRVEVLVSEQKNINQNIKNLRDEAEKTNAMIMYNSGRVIKK